MCPFGVLFRNKLLGDIILDIIDKSTSFSNLCKGYQINRNK